MRVAVGVWAGPTGSGVVGSAPSIPSPLLAVADLKTSAAGGWALLPKPTIPTRNGARRAFFAVEPSLPVSMLCGGTDFKLHQESE